MDDVLSKVDILVGDVRNRLSELEDESVHCCVTSPPYFGLRDYGTAVWEGGDIECNHIQGRPGSDRADGVVNLVGHRNIDGVGSFGGDCKKCGAQRIDNQIGLEQTPEEYVDALVEVFREVHRVLRKDGTLWLNLGDSYAGSWGAQGHRTTENDDQSWHGSQIKNHPKRQRNTGSIRIAGVKPKDLYGIPWMVAFALRADGWWLRQDIIWQKPNPMPESVRDRCTKSHEYLFLLTKSKNYYFGSDAIAEPLTRPNEADRKTPGPFGGTLKHVEAGKQSRLHSGNEYIGTSTGTRNKRSVWSVALQPFSEAHFATFSPKLIEPCILAGCPIDGMVLDPFGGAGTTGLVAARKGRNTTLIELNPTYAEMAKRRIDKDLGMCVDVALR